MPSNPPATGLTRLGDGRHPRLPFLLVAVSALVCLAVLYLTSYKSFYVDEWAFVASRREWELRLFLYSHNGHWSTIPILIWKLLFVAVGLRSHIPYEAALLVVHAIAVLLLFMLVRRRSGDLPAFAAATTLLVLGSGGENIVWAFQIGWVGSVAFGLLAMLLLDGNPPFPSRVLPASAALLCSLMCSSVGLIFVGALAIELAFDPYRRRFLVALIGPIAAFVAWFVVYDTGTVPGTPGVAQSFLHGPTGFNYIISLVRFVASGLEASAAGVIGAPGAFGLLLLLLLAALIGMHWYRRNKIGSWQFGLAAGLLAWFVLAGLGRVQFGPSYAAQSRYVYVACVFLLPLLADAVSDIPWRGAWQPSLAVAFALCISANTVLLRDLSVSQKDVMRLQATELQTVEVFRGAPDMSLTSTIDNSVMPQFTAGEYLAAVSELGSPVPRLTLSEIHNLPGQAVDQVMLDVFGQALTVAADPARSTSGLPCRTLQGSTFNLQVNDGQPLMLRSSLGTDALISLGYLDPPTGAAALQVQLVPRSAEWVHLPETGKPIVWQLRIATAQAETILVCGRASIQAGGPAVDEYTADAASGLFDPGWLAVSDPSSSGGTAAEAMIGQATTYRNDVFGPPMTPASEPYDVWFRARVVSTKGSTPEMTLGLWNDQKAAWVGSTTYRADQVGISYTWLKVASHVTPFAGDAVQFIASLTNGPGTDWYIDGAVMATAGSPPPT